MADEIEKRVLEEVQQQIADPAITVTKETPLVGSNGVLDSLSLVELCICLEDVAEEYDFEFEWSSEHAMSKSKGMFRSVGALTQEFIQQKESA